MSNGNESFVVPGVMRRTPVTSAVVAPFAKGGSETGKIQNQISNEGIRSDAGIHERNLNFQRPNFQRPPPSTPGNYLGMTGAGNVNQLGMTPSTQRVPYPGNTPVTPGGGPFARPPMMMTPSPQMMTPGSSHLQQQNVMASQMQQNAMINQLMQLKAAGKASPAQLAQLQQFMTIRQSQMLQHQKLQQHKLQQHQRMMVQQQQQQQSRTPTTGGMIPGQRGQLPQQYQQQQQQRVMQARPSQPGMAGPAAPLQVSNLGPPVNTYGARLRKGGTCLVTSTAPPEPVAGRSSRRSRFNDEYYSDEESESDEQASDLDDDDERDEESRKLKKPEKKSSNEVAPYRPSKKTRLLPTTKHDHEKITLYQHPLYAEAKELLVPINLEFDIDANIKFQDTFSWNLSDRAITPEKFAEYLCHDLSLSGQTHFRLIVNNIKTQLEDFKKYYLHSDVPIPQDTRMIIRLDITVGKVQLRDRFEWDLASDLSPEEFAKILVTDLQLGGEFVTLISHSIREQLFKTKTGGEFDPTFAIEKPFRSEEEAKAWSPFVDCGVKEGDEENSVEQDRKQRLLRRQLKMNQANRRGGAIRGGYLLLDEGTGISSSISQQTQGGADGLPAEMRATWRCAHCLCTYSQASSVMTGPSGEKTLCKSCGLYYSNDGELPDHRLNLFSKG